MLNLLEPVSSSCLVKLNDKKIKLKMNFKKAFLKEFEGELREELQEWFRGQVASVFEEEKKEDPLLVEGVSERNQLCVRKLLRTIDPKA